MEQRLAAASAAGFGTVVGSQGTGGTGTRGTGTRVAAVRHVREALSWAT
jgi:hypothetical protein